MGYIVWAREAHHAYIRVWANSVMDLSTPTGPRGTVARVTVRIARRVSASTSSIEGRGGEGRRAGDVARVRG